MGRRGKRGEDLVTELDLVSEFSGTFQWLAVSTSYYVKVFPVVIYVRMFVYFSPTAITKPQQPK